MAGDHIVVLEFITCGQQEKSTERDTLWVEQMNRQQSYRYPVVEGIQ